MRLDSPMYYFAQAEAPTSGWGWWWLAVIYGVAVVILSMTSFTLYGWDKRSAKLDRRRVSERRLHMIDLAGGWPGGWIGRKTFRHKTSKRSFVIVFWITVIVNLCLVGGAAFGLSTLAGGLG